MNADESKQFKQFQEQLEFGEYIIFFGPVLRAVRGSVPVTPQTWIAIGTGLLSLGLAFLGAFTHLEIVIMISLFGLLMMFTMFVLIQDKSSKKARHCYALSDKRLLALTNSNEVVFVEHRDKVDLNFREDRVQLKFKRTFVVLRKITP
jgi:hypothetical protein